MPEKANAFLKQLIGFWASLPTPKRIALVTVMALVLAGVLAISVLGSRETYGTLYSELATEDAAAIVEKLKTAQVPYKLENGGTMILVPEERVPGLRLELAAGGLPRGGSVGFEIFDRSKIGATEFEQQVNLRRALEGELARSVMSVNGVKAARVHLVLPERRLFAAREETASASVVVKLENAHNFGRREVAAIVHLVAGGYEARISSESCPDQVLITPAPNVPHIASARNGHRTIAKGPAPLSAWRSERKW